MSGFLKSKGLLPLSLSYWGEIAISFKNGQSILLPISDDEAVQINKYLQDIEPGIFLNFSSLDNRAISVNFTNVCDIYLSDDDHGSFGPDDVTPDYIQPDAVELFWGVLEKIENDLEEECHPTKLKQVQKMIEAQKKIIYKEVFQQEGKTPSAKDMANEAVKQWQQVYRKRVNCITWGLDSGKVRDINVYDHQEVYSYWLQLLNLDDDAEPRDILEFKLSNEPRSIFINKESLNYIWCPLHKVVLAIMEKKRKNNQALNLNPNTVP